MLGLGISGIGMAASLFGGGGGAAAGGASAASSAAASAAPAMAGFGGAAMGAGIGMMVGSFLAKMLKLNPMGSMMMSIGGALVGAGAGYLLMGGAIPVLGWALIAVGLVLMLIAMFFGSSICPPKTVKFTCSTWQPPSGGDDCENCNNDPMKPCSEYRCKSLGAACEFLNQGTEEELCVALKNDGSAPQLTPITNATLANNSEYRLTQDGFSITNPQGGCLDAYSTQMINIHTNKPSQCKYDLEMKEFDDMAQYLGTNSFVYDHYSPVWLPDPSAGQSRGLEWDGDLTLYIKCRDTYANEIPTFYTIDMCVNQGPDVTAPYIKATEPEINSILSYNTTNQTIWVYTNEPSECRWSTNNTEYELMSNQMLCKNNFEDITAYGYACNATVLVKNETNKFYIRCKDQKWLEDAERGDERNSNQESFEFTLNKPKKYIQIDEISPSEDFEIGTDFTTVNLQVKTSGGAPEPKCSYSFSGYENMIMFYETYGNYHSQEFNLAADRYTVYVECEDSTGDKARKSTNFRIIHDSSTPRIARIIKQGSILKVMTSENAECKHSTESCTFNFDSDKPSAWGTEYTISYEEGTTYYVKCRDINGNEPDGCSVIIR